MIFKCKNCGGNAVYHPDKKAMWCPHCDSLDSQERLDTENMENCTNCGAPLEQIGEFTSALKCAHCGYAPEEYCECENPLAAHLVAKPASEWYEYCIECVEDCSNPTNLEIGQAQVVTNEWKYYIEDLSVCLIEEVGNPNKNQNFPFVAGFLS